jgi:hypothetical protein
MTSKRRKLSAWFYEGISLAKTLGQEHRDHWWRVMCLTGVDYFSSMGFQPGIAFLAAGLLSPFATLNLVLLTLAGALPAYWLVAKESPHGQGSFAILERLMSGWKGKALVLVLLGFAATDFVFTITMCTADATAHIVENPWVPHFANDRIVITTLLIGLLSVVFMVGFHEAVRISFWLVLLYLGINFVTLARLLEVVLQHQELVSGWLNNLSREYHSFPAMLMASVFVFPQLALGLSGFETGVAVMPLVKTKSPHDLIERVKNTRLLLVTVALIMSVFLLAGGITTTVLIPPELFQENGAANGRALAYLAHLYLGDIFGAFYDLSTVLILWFAGASGMAALVSLVPQYLPRYGMAPEWASARRPLVVFFTLVSFVITWIFGADVDAQAGAFATGLLVLITSACVAVTLSLWQNHKILRYYFFLISAAFLYASIAIMIQRPDGLQISLIFVAIIIFTSFVSRALRSTELRIGKVVLDDQAQKFIDQALLKKWGEIRLLSHRPGASDYQHKEIQSRRDHSIQLAEGDFIFLEVDPQDVSEFVDDSLEVTGHQVGDYQILRCSSAGVPNAIAAILLHVRNTTGQIPHAYLGWTEGHPIFYMLKYIILGEGETAPLTREILRSSEPDPDRRPKVHVA